MKKDNADRNWALKPFMSEKTLISLFYLFIWLFDQIHGFQVPSVPTYWPISLSSKPEVPVLHHLSPIQQFDLSVNERFNTDEWHTTESFASPDTLQTVRLYEKNPDGKVTIPGESYLCMVWSVLFHLSCTNLANSTLFNLYMMEKSHI